MSAAGRFGDHQENYLEASCRVEALEMQLERFTDTEGKLPR